MKKEIIVVTTCLGNDGAERVLSILIKEWVEMGEKVTIVQTDVNPKIDAYDLPLGIELIEFRLSNKNKILKYIEKIKKLVKYLKSRRNATVISFINDSTFTVACSSLFVRNRMVFSERNNPREIPVGKSKRFLRNISFLLADYCIFQTKEARDYFPKSVRKKSKIILNPINPNLPDIYKGKRDKSIVAACRLTEQKNLPMLIKAFSRLSFEFQDYNLYIYGQGELEEQLKRLTKELGLEKRVFFPGFTNDIHNIIRKSTMYVSSSNYEGISNSMLEALAMGVPCVCTDCPVGGTRMIIKNMKNGILIPVNDDEALYKGMKTIITNRTLAYKMSENAYNIRKLLPIEKIAKSWIDIL